MAGLTGHRRPQACRVWTVVVRNRDEQDRCEAELERSKRQAERVLADFEELAAQIGKTEVQP